MKPMKWITVGTLLMSCSVLSGCATHAVWERDDNREEPRGYQKAFTDGESLWIEYTGHTYGRSDVGADMESGIVVHGEKRRVRYNVAGLRYHRMDRQLYQYNAYHLDYSRMDFSAPPAPASARELPIAEFDARLPAKTPLSETMLREHCSICEPDDQAAIAYLFEQNRLRQQPFLLVSTRSDPVTGTARNLVLVRPDPADPATPLAQGLSPPWRLVPGEHRYPLAARLLLTPLALVADIVTFPLVLIWSLYVGDITG